MIIMNGIFNSSKYTRWYSALMWRATGRTIVGGEKHHIIPKCLGGTECVRLTHREHFVAHLLLTRMTISSIHKQKMHLAFFALCNGFNQSSKFASSRWFESARIKAGAIKSEILRGRVFSDHSKQLMSRAAIRNYNLSVSGFALVNSKPKSTEHKKAISMAKRQKPAAWLTSDNAQEIKDKISRALRGKIFSPQHKDNISKSLRGRPSKNKGVPMSEASKRKLRVPKTLKHKLALRKPKARGCCVFCRQEASIGMLKRFHTLCVE